MDKAAIERVLTSLEAPMLETLRTLVRIPSVKEAGVEGAPFGRPARQALDTALSICEGLGFACVNADGYAGHADLGEGPDEDALAILGHLDVVPIGDNWTVEPFGAEIRGDRMYGRGTSDDKGPVVAAMYAMAAVRQLGVPLKRKVRLIMGTDEESGWEDIAYYKTRYPLPRSGFSPDAEFPVINIEKGHMNLELTGKPAKDGLQVLRFDTGDRPNVVPGRAEALVLGDGELADRVNRTDYGFPVSAECVPQGVVIRTEGVPGHAAMPEHTRNAIGQMLLVLRSLGVRGALRTLADAVGTEYDGASLGIAITDRISGPLTCNLGIIRADGEHVRAVLDLRCPILSDMGALRAQAQNALPGLKVSVLSLTAPHYVSAGTELVRSLLAAYEEVTGEKGYTVAIGGGTYAKCLEEGVAFGSLFPGEQEMAHQADEYVSLESLKKNLRIFTYAILKLAADKKEAE